MRGLRESALTARAHLSGRGRSLGSRYMDRKVEARPPALVERAIRLLLPPMNREHVLGDLAERHRIRRRLDQLERTTEIVTMPSQSHSSAAAVGVT